MQSKQRQREGLKELAVPKAMLKAAGADVRSFRSTKGPDFVRQSEEARRFVRAFDEAFNPIATLCHGPWVLVSRARPRQGARASRQKRHVRDEMRRRRMQSTRIFAAESSAHELLCASPKKDPKAMLGELVEMCTPSVEAIGDAPRTGTRQEARRANVFVLAPDGPDTLPSRGWRGYFIAIWPLDVPVGVAVAAALDECGAALELHTVVDSPEGRAIVLRATTCYRQTIR